MGNRTFYAKIVAVSPGEDFEAEILDEVSSTTDTESDARRRFAVMAKAQQSARRTLGEGHKAQLCAYVWGGTQEDEG